MSDRRSTNWATIRGKALYRDDETCQECGASGDETDLEVHHKTPVSEGGSDDLENLITLCRECHLNAHGWEKREDSHARALLTEGERRAVMGAEDMSDNSKASHLSRIRNKLDRFREDARLLRQNREDIYEDACEAFADAGGDAA